jgi:hypothetical protein
MTKQSVTKKRGRENHFRSIPVNFTTSTLRVAIVQLEGPLPSAKVAAVGSGGRETFAWSSMDEVNRRIDKAIKVITFVVNAHPGTNVIIFPEYSIPIELALPQLRRASAEHDVVIIPGADNIPQRNSSRVISRCPIIIPNQEPIWVNKQNPSKWEEGKVDKPLRHDIPLFSWKHDKRRYHFRVSICLDFPTVIYDATNTGDDPLLHFVPMCSPDNPTFHTYADTLLWEVGGRAVFLANCVGTGAAGGSAVFAVTPAGARLKPAVSLSSNHESIAIVDVHCDRLVPPKRSGKEPKGCLGQVFLYQVQTSAAGIEIVPTDPAPAFEPVERGVLNPSVFAYLGKQLRMTFLGVEGYGAFDKQAFSQRNFELYSVLGHHDVMVTHLHHDAYTLLYDVNQTLAWKLRTGVRSERQATLSEQTLQQFPYFEVSAFHKVLGHSVPAESAGAFDLHPPTPDDLAKLLDLGMDWNAADEAFRNGARAKGWILDVTRLEPGAIDAVMTVYLDHPTEIQGPLETFDRLVVPELVGNPIVTSVCRHWPQNVGALYSPHQRAS